MNEKEIINVSVPSFFDKLGGLINATSKRTLANYFLWRNVFGLGKTMSSQIRRKRLAYLKAISGKEDEEPRWKECIGNTLNRYY